VSRRAVLIPLALTLAGCASSLPVYESRVHVVQPGETLYAIAWRHGLDYRVLARWNGMRNPDLIFVGQRLRLTPPASTGRPVSSRPAVSRPSPSPAKQAPKRSPSVPTAPAARRSTARPRWQWPTRGTVVSSFGSSKGIPSGIGIRGQLGQPIRAAAPGRVVYAGSGLIGYGQLVIIKHNDTYLSAYGNNNRLLVDQGQQVSGGEEIAEMGLGPGRTPRLHFEIRRNGTPVDPLRELSSAGR
jgi:lipoprotein NlpD